MSDSNYSGLDEMNRIGLSPKADPSGTIGLDAGNQNAKPTDIGQTAPNGPPDATNIGSTDPTSMEYINREDNPLTQFLMRHGLGSRAHARHVQEKLQVARYMQQQQEQELVNGQKQLVLMGDQIQTLSELDEKDRPHALAMFKQEWNQRGDGLGDLMQHMSESRLAHAADLREAINLDPTLNLAFKSGGMAEVVNIFNTDKDVRNRVDAYAISKLRQPVLEKSIAALKYLQKYEPVALAKATGKDQIQTEELVNDLNPKLPENLRFKPEEIQVLDLDPTAQRTLGYEPSAKATAREEEYAKSLSQAKAQAMFREPPPGVNVLLPNGQIRISNDRGRTVIINGQNVPAPEGSQLYTSQAQGTLADLTPGVTPGKKERQAAGTEARASSERIASVSESLDRILKADPGVVGMKGAIAEGVAGALGQISPDAADSLTEYVTGMGAEDLANLRSNLKVIGPKSIKQFTGETSGRITDKELAISTEATKAMATGASKEQVVGGLRALISMDLLTRDRNMVTAGINPDYDPSTEEGTVDLANDLIHKYGFAPQGAGLFIRAMRRQRELLYESGAKPNAAK